MTARLTTPEITIRPFIPAQATADEWRDYHAYRNQRTIDDAADWAPITDAVRQREMLTEWPLGEEKIALALIGGRIVGSTIVSHRRAGTPDYEEHAPFAFISCGVLKDCRRQGVGMRLLGVAAGHVRDNDQTTATMSSFLPEGWAFLDKIGAVQKHRMMENRLNTAHLDWDLLSRWERLAGSAGQGLTWEIYPSRMPSDRYDALAPTMSALLNSQPLGELETPPIRYNRESREVWYATMDEHGGDHFTVLLNDGDSLVAMCEASWEALAPERAYQQLTAVATQWRGKGLAKAVKARMVRLMRATHPEIKLIVTNNANVNAAMLAINTRLGFVQHKDMRTFQMKLDAIEAAVQAAASA
jgi:GNAT superfamily N-acetyltransferase